MHNAKDLPIVIAGAGIGGLTASLALRRKGHEVVVLEKAGELAEVGAGLQLSPNACSVLDGLGLLEPLSPHAFAPGNLRISSGNSGDLLAKVRLGDFIRERHRFPFWVAHRADLQKTLLEAVRKEPGISLRLGTEVNGLKADPYDPVKCTFTADGKEEELECQALIGADGVWSRTRRLIPDHKNAVFSGQVAYRATIPIDDLPSKWKQDSGLWLHRNSHLVHYPVRGGRELNIVVLATEQWQDETWSAKADKEDLVRVFKGWPAEIRNLLNMPESWLKWALCSVDGNGPWTHGHIAIMGDAAHAMLPYMAQGAGMSIEDAAVLAECLPADCENVPAALRNFERLRKPRAVQVQKIAMGNAKTFHYSGPMAMARNTVLRLSKPESLAARFDDVYGWTLQQ